MPEERKNKKLEQYLKEKTKNKRSLGRTYRKIIFCHIFFKILKSFFKKFLVLGFKFSYKSAIILVVAILVYTLSPAVLSAPRSVSISTKAEWDLGTLSGLTTENSTDSIQLSPAGTWTARVWTPPEDVIGYGHTSVMVGNYLYIFRGYSGNTFWRYDTLENTWSNLSDLPQPAYYGADMVYNENAGKIYAVFGGYSQKFYSYDIEEDEWTQLENLLDTPWTGAALESDEDSIYMLRGNASTDFWEFEIDKGVWRGRAPITLTASTGANLVNGQDGNLYAVRGGATQNFYRFNISANRWYTTAAGGGSLASTPSTGCTSTTCTFGGEQKGVFWNGKIYFMRSSGYTDFLEYNISDNAWTVLTTDPAPQAVNYGSLTFNENDGYIYAFRSNGTTDFWKYDPDGTAGQRWVGPKQIANSSGTLIPVGTGGDLIWNGTYLYSLQGNNTTAVYYFNPGTNTWTAGTVLPYAINNDIKGTANTSNGYLYALRYGNASVVYIFNGSAWSAMSSQPSVTAGEGAGLTFVGSDLYYLRGGANACMYKYSSSWGSCITTAVTESGTTTTYYPNVGARIISDGTNIYMMPGDGEASFLKYTVASGTWSKMTNTPFSQYYGTDMTYDSANSKIYALAGIYKDEAWEYTILTNTWRRIPNNQKFTFGRGPYNGASIEYTSGTSIYATIGQGTAVPSASADVWSYTVPTTNFSTVGTYTYTSSVIDLGQVSSGTAFSFNENKPANTSTKYEICTNDNGSECTSWHNISDGVISDLTINRYAWIKITLATSDGVSTPTVYDYTISYNCSDTNPSTPTDLIAKSAESEGVDILTETEYVFEHPYFSWSPGTDNGAGVAGYYVYFGKDNEIDPEEDGIYQTTNNYSVNEALSYDTDPVRSYGTYYLIIKTKDNNGLVSEAWSPFTYKYKGVSPTQTLTKTSQDDFNQNGADFDSGKISYSAVDGALRLNNVAGFWNQSRLSASPYYTYTGSELARGECKTNGATSLSSNHCLYTFQGNSQLVFMRYEIETDTWINSTANPTELSAAPLSINNGSAIVEGPEGYIYATRGNSSPTFWRYDIANYTWTQLDDAPKKFDIGSLLSYDNERYIYAMPGNDDALYRYDTCNGESGDCTPEWTQLSNANFGNPNTSDGQRTYYGADSIYDGRNNVYVIQGNLYPYFAKYSIEDDAAYGESQDSWTVLSAAPIGFYQGGAVTFDGDHTIYVLAGNSRMKFLKYDINDDEWSFLPDAPATISYGASLKYYNGYIYTTRGGTYTTFYRFNTTTNTWDLPNRDFFGPHNVDGSIYFPFSYGALMANDNAGKIYLGRGGYDNTFGVYDIESGNFTNLSDLPMGAHNGANIVYNGTEEAIYYVPGSGIRARRSVGDTKNNYFYKYDIATNIWTEITTDRPLAQIYTGSSMVYDGSRYIYLTQGNGTTTWWQYDTQGTTGSRWLALSTTGSCTSADGSKILYKDDYIYKIQAGGSTTNCRYSVAGGSWSTLSVLPATVSYGAALMDGKDGYLYVTRGGNTNAYYRYSIDSASWENLTGTVVPGQVYYGGIGANESKRNWIVAGVGGGITYGDGLYNYVVGSASGATGFEKTGTYISEAIDLTAVYRFANLTANYVLSDNTAIEIQTRTSADGSIWESWSTVSNDHSDDNVHVFDINSNPNPYLQVKIIFSSSDQIYSPRLDDFSINYYQDIEAPTNPTSVSAYNENLKTTSINNDTWYNFASPYFEWPEAEVSGGATDNQGGSGISGYYVYFGTDPNADPVNFQDETSFAASGLVSGSTYYLKIQAADNAGMISANSYSAFVYKYDNVSPTNPSTIEVNPTGYSSATSFTFTWNSDATDANAGVAKLQYRTGGDLADTWTDILDPSTVSQSALPYQPNKNTFYLRVVDNAGNASAAITQDFYYSGGAASPPQNLTVNPDETDNAANEFTFTWELPESYSGDSSKLKYYYSINALPTAYNTIETTASAAGPGPFATQYGKNTFYVVALNEGGVKTNSTDIDWKNPAQIDFYAQTTAPGPPQNIQIFDTSDRESAEYSIALKWSLPTTYDEGNFAGYAIYRSDDNSEFTEVATTTGLAYVDTNLESRLYYYYVKSKDKTSNYSIETSTVELIPTGRYTSPPTITSEPKLAIQSFQSTFIWGTNRVASSFVEYGKTITLGETTGQVDSVTDHSVEVKGLEAETKYYYRVKYIDPDGNIGTSLINNFTTLPPPKISDVVISDVGLSSAIISWKTNVSSTCTLKYGKGSYSQTIEESSGSTSHVARLEKLESNNTTYSFMIEAVDSDSNVFSSDEYTFTTLKQASVSDVQVQNKDNVDLPTISVYYKTDEATSTLVKYKSEDESNYHIYLTNESATEHTADIIGLEPEKEYELVLTGISSSGVEAVSVSQKITTKSDSRPPVVLTNRAVSTVNGRGENAQASLYVKIETDEVTKVKVKFDKGVVSSNFEQSTPEDEEKTYHLITIPVEAGQVYSYLIEAFDKVGNLTTTKAQTIVIGGKKQSAAEVVTSTFEKQFGWLGTIWKK